MMVNILYKTYPVERWGEVVSKHFAGNDGTDTLGVLGSLLNVGLAGLRCQNMIKIRYLLGHLIKEF